jgi:hypothetical protein
MGLYDNPESLKNNEGFKLLKSGSKSKGLDLLREAALNGQPNSLATIIWHYMLDDNIKKAIKDYELCIVKTEPWNAKEKSRIDKLWLVSSADKRNLMEHYFYQVSNSKSNAALAYLASGKEQIATDLWNEAAENHGHIEARFYPVFNLCKSNPTAAIGVLKNSFTKAELQDLVNTLVEVSGEGKGWFAKWAKDGLDILKKVSQGKGAGVKGATTAAAASSAGYMAAKNINKFVKDQMEESLDEGGEAFDWLQDLF